MALVDHLVVLSHLQPQVVTGPPTISYEEHLRTLGMPAESIALLRPDDLAARVGIAGEAVVTHRALELRPNGLAVEVAWACGCGVGLHVHHELALGAWAKHAAAEEGVDADHLERHAVTEIEARWRPDATPRVHCRCGEHFTAAGHLPDDALAAWERHVRAA